MIRCRLTVKITVVLGACAIGCQSNVGPQRADITKHKQPPMTQVASKSDPKPATAEDPFHPRIKMETSLGDMVFRLDAQRAPATVLYFMDNVFAKRYDGTIFHRVIKDKVIQGGAYTGDMVEHRLDPIPAGEGTWTSPLRNVRGTIAMMRGTQSGWGGMGQFFINVEDNGSLDALHNRSLVAVFGEIVEGKDIMDRIRNVPVSTHPKYAAGKVAAVPVDPVIVKSIRPESTFSAAQIQDVVQKQIDARENAVQLKIAQLERQTGRKAITTESGIQYIDIRMGTGPPVLNTDTIMFNYEGSLADGTVFESTFTDEPKVLPASGLIDGLREGILTINEGGTRFIIVPPELGYGEAGIPGIIPPYSTLFYMIELLEIRAEP